MPSMIQWRGGFGDLTVSNASAAQKHLVFRPASRQAGFGQGSSKDANAAKNGPLTNTGSLSFAGVEDRYFAAVFLPAKTHAIHQVSLQGFHVQPASVEKDERVGVAVSTGVPRITSDCSWARRISTC